MNVLDRFISAVKSRDIDTAYNLLVSDPSIISALEEYVENYKDIIQHILELYMIRHNKIIDNSNPIIQRVFGSLPDEIRKLDRIIARTNIVKIARTKDLDTLLKEIEKYRKYLDESTINSVIEYKIAQELLNTNIDKLAGKLGKIEKILKEYGLKLPKNLDEIAKMISSYEELVKNREKMAEGVASHLTAVIKKKISNIISKYRGNIEAGLQNTEFITALELAGIPKPVINKAKMILQSKEFKEILSILNQLESEAKLPPEELSAKVFSFLSKVRELEQLLNKYRGLLGNKYNDIRSSIINMLNNAIPPIAYYLAGKGEYNKAVQVLNIAEMLGANTGRLVAIINNLRRYNVNPRRAVSILHSIE